MRLLLVSLFVSFLVYLTSCNKPKSEPKICAVGLNIALIDEVTGQNLTDIQPEIYNADSIKIGVNGVYGTDYTYTNVNDTLVFVGFWSDYENRIGEKIYTIYYNEHMQDTIEMRVYGNSLDNKRVSYYLNNVLLDSLDNPCNNFDYYLVVKK